MTFIKRVFIFILLASLPFAASAADPNALNDGSGSNSSFNWSGYVATGGTFTSITGTWTVPTIPATNSLSADAIWVGIGGAETRNLIQAGTQAVTDTDGSVSYEAWYEMLPDTTQPIGVPLSPGDSVTASVTQVSPGNWAITIKNNTTGQVSSANLQYDSSLASAEWIEEMPTDGTRLIPLDNFGTSSFTDGSAVKDGQTVTIGESGAQPLTMVNQIGDALAVPSDLGPDGASFTVTRTNAAVSLVSSRRHVIAVPQVTVTVEPAPLPSNASIQAELIRILEQLQTEFSQFALRMARLR